MIFSPLRIQSLRKSGLITDLESWTRREAKKKKREEKSSPYFEVCVVPWRPRKQGWLPKCEKVCFPSFLPIMAKFGAQFVSFFSFFSLWDCPNVTYINLLIYIYIYIKFRWKNILMFFSFNGWKKIEYMFFFFLLSLGGKGGEML